VLAVFFVPVFFVIFQRLQEWWKGPRRENAGADENERHELNGNGHADPRQLELALGASHGQA
jgi:hypothetical protein